jgi:hypothetical protein
MFDTLLNSDSLEVAVSDAFVRAQSRRAVAGHLVHIQLHWATSSTVLHLVQTAHTIGHHPQRLL